MTFDAEEDRQAAELVERSFDVSATEFLDFVADLRSEVGGMTYLSRSWSFGENILFAPTPDVDVDDPEPMVSLVRHTVAHPFGVWVGMSGVVRYMCPGEWDGDYVEVFSDYASLIESDAVHQACLGWTLVESGNKDTFDRVRDRVTEYLPVLDVASGPTESWLEAEGVRAHLWRTWADVFQQEDLVRWAVWARDSASSERARAALLAL
ncbi:hypothetical protein ACFYOT_14865 [Saccharothrix saharensis]|uniref:hypothetical protein n=1 Tax=Saccharothrix saharensis TaxID=571190 RepID=UPI0036BB07BC